MARAVASDAASTTPAAAVAPARRPVATMARARGDQPAIQSRIRPVELSSSCLRVSRTPITKPIANTSVGSRVPCTSEGRASGCRLEKVTPNDSSANVARATIWPSAR